MALLSAVSFSGERCRSITSEDYGFLLRLRWNVFGSIEEELSEFKEDGTILFLFK